MFIQIALAIVGLFLLYIGITDKSILNTCLGLFLTVSSAGMFYAAKTGSSIQERIVRWQEKGNGR